MNTTHVQPNDHLAQRVLNRIEGEHLVPRPRWEFLLKNYVFWGLGAFAVVLGALAFSATLFEITNVDWRLGGVTHPDLVSFFFAAAPIFWVIALALFVLIGYVNVRYTNHGYRYPLLALAFGAVMLSVSLGSAVFATGFGREVEEFIGDHPPFYRPISAIQQSWWLAPERGLLGGQVAQLASTSTTTLFTVHDSTNHTWEVDGSDLPARDRSVVAHGGEVRIVGVPAQVASSSVFHACFVFSGDLRRGPRGNSPLRSPASISSSTERKMGAARSEICKGIRPYQQLRSIDGDDE